MTIKKRASTGGQGGGASPAKKKKTPKRTTRPAGGAAADAKRPARRVTPKSAARPRIRASHSTVPDVAAAPRARASRAGGRPLKALPVDIGPSRGELKPKAPGAGLRKAPLTGPRRDASHPPRRAVAPDTLPEASSASRELALALAAAALDKKAIGVEILDVTGKVDYADFLVVMTGRSDRHVHAIATGIEEAMRRRKLAPLSMEGLASASWVLIDFADVVVHVFQEEARAVYDIEGLWIDAGRIPVPESDKADGAGPGAPRVPAD